MPTAPAPRHQPVRSSAAEGRLWRCLRGGKLGACFGRRVTLGPFVAGFACLARRLIVECDGGRHPVSPYDNARDIRLMAAGWRVLRIRSEEILADTDAVCTAIRAVLAAPLPVAPPPVAPPPVAPARETR